MPVTLIQQNPDFDKKVEGDSKLAIAEMFADTIQGEGVSAGTIATFIRLQGCTLQCVWCDTLEVWPNGNEYSFDEILDLLEPYKEKFLLGQRLVLTGGSPLKQQSRLIRFLHSLQDRFGFLPIVEVENEAVLMPDAEFVAMVSQWNNSPKLANSGMKPRVRFKPEVIQVMSVFDNSWFKFVIANEDEWKEIEGTYLPYIRKSQVILMPEGQTQQELNKSREFVADMAIKHGVRFSDRLHVTIWDKKTGV
jgi:7-carboxy-7-deazaguanine synthase